MSADMKDTHQCIICGRWSAPDRKHVDTCGERCFKRLLVLQRDSFARADLVKESALSWPCDWCGQDRKLAVYHWVPDGQTGGIVARYWNGKRFCSVSCWRSYNA